MTSDEISSRHFPAHGSGWLLCFEAGHAPGSGRDTVALSSRNMRQKATWCTTYIAISSPHWLIPPEWWGHSGLERAHARLSLGEAERRQPLENAARCDESSSTPANGRPGKNATVMRYNRAHQMEQLYPVILIALTFDSSETNCVVTANSSDRKAHWGTLESIVAEPRLKPIRD
jgi:hypothetical protein